MIIEQRLEQVEQQSQQLQRTYKWLTVALTMMAVTICAVVTMAATGEKGGVYFDTVTVRTIFVKNDAGNVVAAFAANDDGDGVVITYSAKGNTLVRLNANKNGGLFKTYQPNGKDLVKLGATVSGGMIEVYNRAGLGIAAMYAWDYGNGLFYARNRKGKWRTIEPGS